MANQLLFYDTGEGEANSIAPVGVVPMKFGWPGGMHTIAKESRASLLTSDVANAPKKEICAIAFGFGAESRLDFR